MSKLLIPVGVLMRLDDLYRRQGSLAARKVVDGLTDGEERELVALRAEIDRYQSQGYSLSGEN